MNIDSNYTAGKGNWSDVKASMGFKHTIRGTIDALAKGTGMLSRCERQMTGGITVLMYHRVLEDDAAWGYPLAPLAMPVSWFREQVRWLAAQTRVLTVAEAMASDMKPEQDGKPVVCLTFDDGYVDNFELAAPILEEFDVRGTFYLTAGNVAERTPLWFDRAIALHGAMDSASHLGSLHQWLETLKLMSPEQRCERLDDLDASASGEERVIDCQLMTLEQGAKLALRGHEIGSHTLSHPILPQLDEVHLTREIAESRMQLQAAIGSDIEGFCYPNGDHDERVERIVREAGYSYACGTQSGRNDEPVDRYRLRRIDINRSRVGREAGAPDELAFRSEICLLRERYRTLLGR